MLKLVLCGLAFLAVASAQTCDCNAFAQCIANSKQSKMQCFDNCKSQLEPTLRAAMDQCKPPKDDSKMQCIISNACTTSASTGGRFGGKHHGGKHGGKMRMLSQFLTDAQQQSMEAFKTCARACHEQGGDTCKTQNPNCGFDHSKMEAAKATCGVGDRPDHSESCKCFLNALGASDTSVCDNIGRFGGGGKGRRQRSASGEDDDSIENLF